MVMKEMIARVGDIITQSGIGSVCLTGEDLVRCKDCEYSECYPIKGILGQSLIECHHEKWNCEYWPLMDADGYCSLGLRRG